MAGTAPHITVHFKYSLVAAIVSGSAPSICKSGVWKIRLKSENTTPLTKEQ